MRKLPCMNEPKTPNLKIGSINPGKSKKIIIWLAKSQTGIVTANWILNKTVIAPRKLLTISSLAEFKKVRDFLLSIEEK